MNPFPDLRECKWVILFFLLFCIEKENRLNIFICNKPVSKQSTGFRPKIGYIKRGMNTTKLKLWISPLGRCWAPLHSQKPALKHWGRQWEGWGQSGHGKALCPSQELQSKPRNIIPAPAFTHLSRSHSQRSETFETLSRVSLPHVTLSNAQFVFYFGLLSTESDHPSVPRGRDPESQQRAWGSSFQASKQQ